MLIIDDEEDQAYGCIEYLENDDDDFFAGGGESQRKRRRHAAVVTDTGSSSEPNRSSSEEDFGAGKAEAASVLEASGGRPIDYWQSMQGCDGDQCAARNRGKGKDGARRIVGRMPPPAAPDDHVARAAPSPQNSSYSRSVPHLEGSLSGSLTKIVFGTDIFDKRAVSIPVSRYVRPKDVPGLSLSSEALGDDLVLIKLARAAPREWRRVGVGVAGDVAAYSRSLKLLGFGDAVESDTDYSSGVLRSIELVPVTAKSDAKPDFFARPLDYSGRTGTCNGDSGGALLLQDAGEAAAAPRRRQLDVAALRGLDDAAREPVLGRPRRLRAAGVARAGHTPVDVPF
ncbi:hypothetical protein JL720_4815 [Aureococcus anophagefferens]|nr:hypothetical protein JL720_4815 [Aureococcus anophagefferens]